MHISIINQVKSKLLVVKSKISFAAQRPHVLKATSIFLHIRHPDTCILKSPSPKTRQPYFSPSEPTSRALMRSTGLVMVPLWSGLTLRPSHHSWHATTRLVGKNRERIGQRSVAQPAPGPATGFQFQSGRKFTPSQGSPKFMKVFMREFDPNTSQKY